MTDQDKTDEDGSNEDERNEDGGDKNRAMTGARRRNGGGIKTYFANTLDSFSIGHKFFIVFAHDQHENGENFVY